MDLLRNFFRWALFWSVMVLFAAPAVVFSAVWSRIMSAVGLWDHGERRRRVSRTAVSWGDRLFRLWAWCSGRFVMRLPHPDPQRPAIIIANHRHAVDVLALAHVCRQMKIENVRWVAGVDVRRVPVLGWALSDVCVFVRRRGERVDRMNLYVTAVMEADNATSFVVFPEGARYSSGRAHPDWTGVLPPRTGCFTRLCAATRDCDVVTLALVWRNGPSDSRPVVAVLGERHRGVPRKPEEWLQEEWRRVEATIMPFL